MRLSFPGRGPFRPLATSWLVKTVGSGLYLPSSALYFTHVAGLSARQVGYGLAIAGIVGLGSAVPLGSAADRWGARRVYQVLLVLQCLVMAALSLVRGYAVFVIVISAFSALEQGSTAARGALVAAVGEGAERALLRARLRVITNIGISIGAGAAALVIQVNTAGAYTALLLITALTYPAAGLPLRRLPAQARAAAGSGSAAAAAIKPGPARGPGRYRVLSDRRYVTMTALSTVLTLQAQVLSFAVPLWIAGYTSAPRALVAVVVIVNTAMVILFQVRASRGTEDLGHAARLCRRSGLALLASCAVISLTAHSARAESAALLFAFAILLTLGELWFSAGTFALSFNLAPDDAHGQYQGFFSLTRGISAAVAPVLLSWLCLRGSGGGWIALGVIFAVAGSLVPMAIRPPVASPGPDPRDVRLG